MIRIGINGFGRIGRVATRAIAKHFPNLEVVAVNDLVEPDYLGYLLKYDSVHGSFPDSVLVDRGTLCIGDKKVRLTAIKEAEKINWSEAGVDVVLDCTGMFLTTERAQRHLVAGARKVIQSAPAKDDTPMFVYGVNHYNYAGQNIISAASCTTNCLAPVAKVINDHWGLRRGLMTTVHAATASQRIVDGGGEKDWRASRSVFENIIPTSTGAAKAVGRVLPELLGKLTGMAFRIPSANVSVVDLSFETHEKCDFQDICKAMHAASKGDMKDVLDYSDEAVVATDLKGASAASTFDATAGIALDETFFKVVSWYDNEYSYACNLLRLGEYVAKQN